MSVTCSTSTSPNTFQIQTIEDQVWELAREIETMTSEERKKCFHLDDDSWIFNKLSYEKAKKYHKKWLEELKEKEFHVGDEVIFPNGYTYILTKVTDNYLNGIYIDVNSMFITCKLTNEKNKCQKTGKTFPELKEFLKKYSIEEENINYEKL